MNQTSVAAARFELAISWSQTTRTGQLYYATKRAAFAAVLRVGIEPTFSGLQPEALTSAAIGAMQGSP